MNTKPTRSYFKRHQRREPDFLTTAQDNELDLKSVRAEFIKKNAIQVKAPTPSRPAHAMDSCSNQQYQASYEYVNQHILAYFIGANSFIGYHAMSLIAQHWLVMKGCSSAVKDAMKKGYELTKNNGDTLDKKKVSEIQKLDKKYKLNKNIIEGETFNNVFGIRHILFKHSDPDFDYEQPFNADAFKGGKYAGMSQIDPYWITPELSDLDITDPTSIGYYEPTFWLINSKRYHKSHFVILEGEPVADYLKPTYRYGGIGMVQKLYERVYAGERTANEIPQLAMTKRRSVRKVDLVKAQANKEQFIKNLNTSIEYQDNYAQTVIGKDEDLSQQETSLADLDSVMWAEYHLVAAIFGRPVSKIYGTGHGGFSTGETDDDYDISMLEALQSANLEEIAYAHYERLMMSEFGEEMDLDIVWNPLKVMSDKELAEVNKIKADTDTALFMVGSIDGPDSRERLIKDKTSGYSGIEMFDIDEGPEDDDPEDGKPTTDPEIEGEEDGEAAPKV